ATDAGPRRLAGVAAWAWVHGRNQREPRWKGHAQRGTRDHHVTIFERLPQRFQRPAWKLQQLVEEQHAVMRQAHLARAWISAAANESGGRDGVMWRPKWPARDAGTGGCKQAGNGMNGRDLERFRF